MMANDPMRTTVALKRSEITGTRNWGERRIPSQFIKAHVYRACMNATDVAFTGSRRIVHLVPSGPPSAMYLA
jgi:hypothetical protein